MPSGLVVNMRCILTEFQRSNEVVRKMIVDMVRRAVMEEEKRGLGR